MIKRSVLILLLSAWCAALSGIDFFQSNSMGMAFEAISPYRADEFEYILTREDLTDSLVFTLFQDDQEVQKWIYRDLEDGSRAENIFKNGVLTSRLTYSRDGLILTESRYAADNGIEETLTYSYNESMLIKTTATDGAGAFLYEDIYIRGSGGRLVQVQRLYADGTSDVTGYGFSNNELNREWYSTPDEAQLLIYENRRTLFNKQWKSDKLVFSEEYRYRDDGSFEKSVSDREAGVSTEQVFNTEGLLVRETGLSVEGKIILEYEYDQQARIVYTSRRSAGLEEVWEYTYDSEGVLTREVFNRNGSVISMTDYESDSAYTVVIYRREKPFLRIKYVDEAIVSEELIRSE